MQVQKPVVAIVGGSVAGLAAALAAAPRASTVVLLERHAGPQVGPASVAPQGAFPHVLLAGGAAALERLSPGFASTLRHAGAVGARGARTCHWWAEGRVLRELPDLGVDAPMCSRALVETVVRARVEADSRVAVWWGTAARALRVADGRVVGLEVDGPGGLRTVQADVVVDATGRAARGSAWLAALGLPEPSVELVGVGLTYTAVEVERRPEDFAGGDFGVVQNSASSRRIAVALPTERDTWQIVLGGYFGDAAPLARDGMVRWAGTLPDPVVGPLVERPWVGEPRRHRFPASQRRRWEGVRLPEGFCALGDAVSSFNPIYGQGMSSAALQALAFAETLDTVPVGAGFSRAFARRAAKIVDNPWKIAAGSDFVYRETTGRRPRAADVRNRYVARVTRAATEDPVVNLALTRVRSMLAPPRILLAPRIALRVLRHRTPERVAARPAETPPQYTNGARYRRA